MDVHVTKLCCTFSTHISFLFICISYHNVVKTGRGENALIKEHGFSAPLAGIVLKDINLEYWEGTGLGKREKYTLKKLQTKNLMILV